MTPPIPGDGLGEPDPADDDFNPNREAAVVIGVGFLGLILGALAALLIR